MEFLKINVGEVALTNLLTKNSSKKMATTSKIVQSKCLKNMRFNQ
jgi:hypothetical protein